MRVLGLLVTSACLLFASADASAVETAMTAGELQQICQSTDAESKSACRFFILGMVQGIGVGLAIADGKTRGGRPCVPDNTPASALELAVKIKMGEDLMVFPDDRKLDASGFVAAIVIKSFPCSNRK